MANDYATIEDLFNIIDLDPEKYSYIMGFFLDASAEHINNITHHDDGFKSDSVASSRLFVGNGTDVINIDDATEITLIETKQFNTQASYDTWISGDWLGFSGSKKHPNFNKTPYTHVMVNPSGNQQYFPKINGFGDVDTPNIRVTAKWGYAVNTPEIIKHCVILQATRWIKRAQAAYGDALVNTDLGQITYIRKFDNDLAAMIFQGSLVKIQI